MRAIILLALLATSAHADVTAVSANGFTSTFRKEVGVAPAQAYDAIGRLPQWWNQEHTYSGKAANLRLGLKAGDCFCEDWDGNSIEHARVLLVMRNQLVRMEGGLGPLQPLAVSGVLTLSTGTRDGKAFMQMVYKVSGAPETGFDKLAPLVDRVMGEQFTRWANYVEKP
ncbi:MAG: ATPase [Burkholderiales bacterium]|nr:ATPase [Burkholderiales bacterium]